MTNSRVLSRQDFCFASRIGDDGSPVSFMQTMEHIMNCIELGTLKELDLADGVTARVVHTGNVSVAHVRLVAGSKVPQHAHHHEQVVNVVDGEMELTVDGKPMVLSRGQVMILPPMVPHSARALSDVYVIDIFHPVREDFRAMAEGNAPGRPYGKK